MTLILYHHPISTCSQKVRLALAEKGCAWESRVVDLPALEHLQDWYLKLNPNGVVPTLVDEGVPVVDSSVICEYLDETRPGPSIAPPDPVGRAHMRAWMRYLEEVPTTAIRVPSFSQVFLQADRALPGAVLAARAEGPPLRKHFYQRMKRGFSQEELDESLDKLRSAVERVEQTLADGRPYLLGQFTIADIVLTPSAVRMQDLGLADLWNAAPNFAAWLARIQARPSFAIAYTPDARLAVGPKAS